MSLMKIVGRGGHIKMELTGIKTKEQARQKAMDYQNWASEQNLSYEELINFGEYFENLGEKFNLTEEFKENCII